MRSLLVCGLVALLAGPAGAEWLHDGELDDWPESAQYVPDPVGDPHKPAAPRGNDGRDLTGLFAELVGDELRVGVGFHGEERGDEEAGLLLLIDADRDASTGKSREGLGCELIWDIGLREGEVFLPGFSGPVKGAQELREFLGILVAPTVTGPAVEVVVPRGDHELFRDRGLYLVVHDERSDDRVPDDGSLTLIWPEPTPVADPIPLERHPDTALRVASYNVEHDGLFEADDVERQAALHRVLEAIDADVWVFSEVWDHDGPQLRARLGEVLERDLSAWSTARRDNGNVIVSRHPIVDTWAIVTDDTSDDPRDQPRMTAARIRTPDRDLLVVANHWRCCDADDERRHEAEALTAFLIDARTPGGRLDLPAETPVVLAGDFNLVGAREPLDIVLANGLGLTAVDLRHPQRPYLHTWHVPGSSYGPGRLDWVFVSEDHVDTPRHYVLDTARVDDATLARHGLRRTDARRASDHFPLVVDLVWK